jgi:hypothetical protein
MPPSPKKEYFPANRTSMSLCSAAAAAHVHTSMRPTTRQMPTRRTRQTQHANRGIEYYLLLVLWRKIVSLFRLLLIDGWIYFHRTIYHITLGMHGCGGGRWYLAWLMFDLRSEK